ncbi:MAG: GTP pyrophosphokinase [Gammaproteobacteria bacterium]|nr:GTP pyrophosphokinase [Gammaproteobacteria bacterium]
MLDKAISLASKAHTGQVDKAGKPYILHPLRLMLKFNDEEEMIVAILHDVVEDSAITLEQLQLQGFSCSIVEAIGCLTKKHNETYEEFIARIKTNHLARRVKIEDIKDNLDLSRLTAITEKDLLRL